MCWDSPPQSCHIFDGETFTRTSESHWPHTTGDIVNAHDNIFLLAGGNFAVEKYNHHDRNWNHVGSMENVVIESNPNATHYLEFTTVAINHTVFTFGGLYGDGLNVDKDDINSQVYAMNIRSYEWRIYEQQLLKPRAWNKVILSGASFAFIGGDNATDIERWTFNGTGFDQTQSVEALLPKISHDYWEVYIAHNLDDYMDCLGPSPKEINP